MFTMSIKCNEKRIKFMSDSNHENKEFKPILIVTLM